MTLIGIDFSINKPAACIKNKSEYIFWIWPYELSQSLVDIYLENGINIFKRDDNKDKGETLSSKICYEVKNSMYLSSVIQEALQSYLNIDTYIAYEGLSYASSGDRVIQLGAYKYMLMRELINYVPLTSMYTFSPITVKSIAGCAKKGMGKKDMINKFIEVGPDCKFRNTLRNSPELFQTKKAKNWITCIDDIVDSYWILETLRKKENL
jgi:hypothetical protein